MALAADMVTVNDVQNRLVGRDMMMGKTIEFLMQSDPFMQDMPWAQCNSGENHEYKARTSIPAGHARAVNDYIANGKSTTEKRVTTTSSLEAWSEIDAEFIDGSAAEGKGNEIRADEAQATIMGIGNQSAHKMLYGSLKNDPRDFDGFMAYYDHLSTDKQDIGYNVIDAGGATDGQNASIIMASWSPQTMYGIYPKGGQMGVNRDDMGKTIDKNAAGEGRPVYQDYYTRKLGLCIEDWRSTVRIANIDTVALAAGSVELIDLLTDAYYRVPNSVRNINGMNPIIYCPTAVAAALTKLSNDKTSPIIVDNTQGKPIKSFWGYSIKECDAFDLEENVIA